MPQVKYQTAKEKIVERLKGVKVCQKGEQCFHFMKDMVPQGQMPPIQVDTALLKKQLEQLADQNYGKVEQVLEKPQVFGQVAQSDIQLEIEHLNAAKNEAITIA